MLGIRSRSLLLLALLTGHYSLPSSNPLPKLLAFSALLALVSLLVDWIVFLLEICSHHILKWNLLLLKSTVFISL